MALRDDLDETWAEGNGEKAKIVEGKPRRDGAEDGLGDSHPLNGPCAAGLDEGAELGVENPARALSVERELERATRFGVEGAFHAPGAMNALVPGQDGAAPIEACVEDAASH